MSPTMHELVRDWDGLSVVLKHDRESGSWFFIALHDSTLGPPTGGCRMKVYARPEDGLLDAMRLARGMTLKFAGAGLAFGGGKSVIALSRELEESERTGTLLRFGRLLEALRGAYWTGEDLGTTPEDMATIARATRFVHGVREEGGGGAPAAVVDPGPYTARGVVAGIRATVAHLFGSDDLAGRTVLVQGVGDVGSPLSRLLAEAGAQVLVSDLDQDRAREVASAVGGTVVPPEEVYETECDIFAPCAVGAVLNRGTIPRLRCRGVAGSANNQLEDESADPERLRARGILHAPDFLVSAGGAMGLIHLRQGLSVEEIHRRIDGIQASVRDVLLAAEEEEKPPQQVAEARVLATLTELEEARGGRPPADRGSPAPWPRPPAD
jgi:leucine dehydrogenase